MEPWKPTWLTNRGQIAAIVFEVNEMSSFEEAEGIADRVCEAFGLDPMSPYLRPEAA